MLTEQRTLNQQERQKELEFPHNFSIAFHKKKQKKKEK